MVQCPVCEKEIPIHLINKHLDSGCEYDPATDGSGGSTQQHTGPVASIFQTPAKKRAGVGIGGGGGSKASPMSVGSGSKGGGLGLGLKNASPGVGTKRVASQTATFPLASKRRGSREEEGGGEGEELDTKDPSPDPPFPVLDLDDGSLSGAPPPAKKQKTTTTEKLQNAMPLAERMRPTSLDDICGQDLVGPDGVLRGLIEKEKVPSMILWGSAGCGKTTIARVIARKTKSRFVEISATSAGVAECKKIFQDAKSELMLTGRKTILFCDEIHRFSKSQQDVFLAPVESGQVTLIGATTENPSFKVQSALLSRCRVFTLKKLTSTDIEYILRRALESEFPPSHKSITGPDNDNKEEGAAAITPPNKPTTIPALLDDEMLSYLALFADGDARTALNLLELAMSLSIREGYTKEDVKKALTRTLVYDRSGDMHYDTISAFHKSVRGNDPDAALFWLGRMLASGEDPLYIARRMVVIASEDVGLADNTLLPLATSTHLAVQQIGLPEARINLAHCAVALAEAPKSVRAYRGLNAVMALLESDPVASGAPVPVHLRNAPTRLMKEMGYGKEYKYNPDYLGGDVLQEYLPEGLPKRRFLEDNHLGWMRDEELEKVKREERERTRTKKEVGRGRGIGTGGWG